MQYNKNKIYFNTENITTKNDFLKKYNTNPNVKPAVINTKIKKEYIFIIGISFVLIILLNK